MKTKTITLLACGLCLQSFAMVNETALTKIIDMKNDANVEMGFRTQIEDDQLIVCSTNGILKKDLTQNTPAQVIAFEGQIVSDYIQKGDTIIGLVNPGNTTYPEWVRSTDNGMTFEKFTIDSLNTEPNSVICMKQHPTDKDIVFISDNEYIWRSKDFCKSWEKVTNSGLHNPKGRIEFHPQNPNIVCAHSENWIFNAVIYTSYDGGDTWDINAHLWDGDNCMHQIAFNPSDPNNWICGGEGVIFGTTDNGKTWDVIFDNWASQTFTGYFVNTVWDSENTNIIYCLGSAHQGTNRTEILASGDGGKNWETVFRTNEAGFEINDMLEYKNQLVIYTFSGVYLLNKSDICPKGKSPLIRKNCNDYITVGRNGITFKQTIDEATIYDCNGRRVFNKKQAEGGTALPAGIYLVKLNIGNETFIQKIAL